MTAPTDLDALLACPRCDRALDRSSDGYRCAGCKVDFPRIGGLPWLFAEPAATLDEWRARWRFALQRLDKERAELESAAEAPGLRAATRTRLTTLTAALADHAGRLQALLAPLATAPRTASYETYLALRTRLPADQGLTTYYANVHRDWCWGDAENDVSLEILVGALGNHAPGRVLVLGAGAGRLAYDFHERTDATLTVALDFNPLLMLVAERVTRGESIELHEFPLAPRSAADQAVLRTLAAPRAARQGLVHVVADAHRPPFAGGAFDTVITPWLIDIVPERFDTLCCRVNALLADGGAWLNFGSMSFHDPDPTARYGVEECVAALADNGFGAVALSEREIPYLNSPSSRHARRERTVSWSATKEKPVKKAPRHEALPDWLVRGTDPVPLGDSFRTQAAATRIHAFMMSMIDGRRSIKDMAKLVVEQRLMSADEAEPAIRTFLMRMYDDSRRGTTY